MHSVGIQISANNDKIPILVKYIGNSMLKFGLDDYEQLQVQMAVEEAFNNIIKHGSVQKSARISIRCFKHNKEIKIIIGYPGECFNPIQNSKPKLKHKSSNNVYYIKRNMNKSDHCFVDGENILTLIKSL